MLQPSKFFQTLAKNKVDFFTGVPDSLLKDFCAFVTDNVARKDHIIAANEGNAVALAIGHHLATGKEALVYMQNSGLGNAVNPLISLADPHIYSIPILLLIGWRGEEGVPDEPQHKKQGKITLPLLETLGIQYKILPKSDEEAGQAVRDACVAMREKSQPYVLVVREGTFASYERDKKIEAVKTKVLLSREHALKTVIAALPVDGVFVSTTGKLSRELFELRAGVGGNHNQDFLTVGGMGHASSIALGIALSKPERKIYCLDGDGAAIMHLGSQGVVGQSAPENYRHIIFNNESHESVGGQPTAASTMDFVAIANACGYRYAFCASTEEEIKSCLEQMENNSGPSLLEIRVEKGARKDLGRPTRTPTQNKEDFMNFLNDGK